MSKIFANDEILTAEDVNDYLNPATAPNVPYAQAAGRISVPAAGSAYTTIAVPMPPGRFTVAPNVMAIAEHSFYLISRAGGSTPNQVVLGVRHMAGQNVQNIWVWWQAVQMTADSADG